MHVKISNFNFEFYLVFIPTCQTAMHAVRRRYVALGIHADSTSINVDSFSPLTLNLLILEENHSRVSDIFVILQINFCQII